MLGKVAVGFDDHDGFVAFLDVLYHQVFEQLRFSASGATYDIPVFALVVRESDRVRGIEDVPKFGVLPLHEFEIPVKVVRTAVHKPIPGSNTANSEQFVGRVAFDQTFEIGSTAFVFEKRFEFIQADKPFADEKAFD